MIKHEDNSHLKESVSEPTNLPVSNEVFIKMKPNENLIFFLLYFFKETISNKLIPILKKKQNSVICVYILKFF